MFRMTQHENDFIAALGAPLLAARPLRAELHRPQAEQLLAHWFSRRRRHDFPHRFRFGRNFGGGFNSYWHWRRLGGSL